MAISNSFTREPYAMNQKQWAQKTRGLVLLMLAFASASCGNSKKPESAGLTAESVVSLKVEPVQLGLKFSNVQAPTYLLHRDKKALRAVNAEGASFGVSQGNLILESHEKVEFEKEFEEKGLAFFYNLQNGWFLSDKTIARLGSVKGESRVLTAKSSGVGKVVFFDDSRLVNFREEKLEIYTLRDLKFVRTEMSWPVKNETPLGGGFDEKSQRYWFATEKSFLYLDEEGKFYPSVPLQFPGASGAWKSVSILLSPEEFSRTAVPKSGAVLTHLGIFATKDLANQVQIK
jgi:hypothetical protein